MADLEEHLLKVPGVRNVRVVGDSAPSEIHIVASGERPAKQIVRDVQSLAQASFGMPIDHRIVSVVQLEEEAPQLTTRRPVIEEVLLASRSDMGWVKVGLRWPDGSRTVGQAPAGGGRDQRARGGALALRQAVEPVLSARSATLEIDHVSIQGIGSHELVIVGATLFDKDVPSHIVGSALIHDDVASAAVRALLQAVNRKIA